MRITETFYYVGLEYEFHCLSDFLNYFHKKSPLDSAGFQIFWAQNNISYQQNPLRDFVSHHQVLF